MGGGKRVRDKKRRAREEDKPNRGTMGGQQTRLVIITARVTPLIHTQWRCVEMGKKWLNFTLSYLNRF